MRTKVGILFFVGTIILMGNPLAITGPRSMVNGSLPQVSASTNGTVAYADTNNWAGYAYCPTGTSFGSICRGGVASLGGSFGCWTVPQVAQTIPSGSAGGVQYLSIWTGVGGVGQSSLAQVGVTVTPGQSVQAWWETLPSTETSVSLTIQPGDLVCGEVEIVGQNPFGQQLIYFSLEDRTSGASWDNSGLLDVCGGAIFWPTCEQVEADSAEWIVESPKLNGQESTVPAFSEVDFEDISVDLGGDQWVPASGLVGTGDLCLLELQSVVAPTSWTMMTHVSPLSSSVDGVTGFSVSYLVELSRSEVMNWGSSVEVAAVFASSDTIASTSNLSSFSLDLTATLTTCGARCRQSSVESAGIPVQNGTLLIGAVPLGHGSNSEYRATACLWWVSPGSSLNQSGSSLLLECASEVPASGPSTVISPVSYSPALGSMMFAMTLYGLLVGEVAAFIGMVVLAGRVLIRHLRPARTSA